jgi:hypothetical protein
LVEIKRNLKSVKDTIVTLKTIQECCRVCNKSYFFLCLNLRQYDTFVALAIEGRKILPVQEVSYGPLIMSIMLIMSCYTGFFKEYVSDVIGRRFEKVKNGHIYFVKLVRKRTKQIFNGSLEKQSLTLFPVYYDNFSNLDS